MTSPLVVVGVDGSPHSQRALAWAVEYAELSGAPIRVISAWQYPTNLGGPYSMADETF